MRDRALQAASLPVGSSAVSSINANGWVSRGRNSAGEEQEDDDHPNAEDEQLCVLEGSKNLRRGRIDQRTQNRSEIPAPTLEGDHRQQQYGRREAEAFGRGIEIAFDIEAPGETGHCGGEHENHELVTKHVDA